MNDMNRRETKARTDSEHRQQDVEMTRDWIFTRGYPVAGTRVEKVMFPKSLTPIRVSK